MAITTVAARNRYTANTTQKHQSDGPECPTDSMPYRRSIIDQSGRSAMMAAKVTGTLAGFLTESAEITENNGARAVISLRDHQSTWDRGWI
jgi:hypothetical protein